MKRTPGFKVLRLDEIVEAYHVKKLFDQYGKEITAHLSLEVIDPYRVQCVSYLGKETMFVSCGFDLFGSRLYEIDDVNY